LVKIITFFLVKHEKTKISMLGFIKNNSYFLSLKKPDKAKLEKNSCKIPPTGHDSFYIMKKKIEK